jgi:hypothetical protein
VASNLNYFDRLRRWRSIRLELNLVYVGLVVVSLQGLIGTIFRIVVQTNALLLGKIIPESFVNLATFRQRNWANPRRIVLDNCECLGERCITLVVSLLKNMRSKMLLLFFIRILSANSIVWACHTSLSLPVCISTESYLGQIMVVNDRGLFDIATSKHTRLQVLVLAVLAIQAL